MRRVRLKRVLLRTILLGSVLTVGGFALLRWRIQSSVDELCTIAQAVHPHPGDNVMALTEYVTSDSHTFSERNRAIWALGQLRDERALSTLQGPYTGSECDHATGLCQYELDKAIRLCKRQTPNLLWIRSHQVR